MISGGLFCKLICCLLFLVVSCMLCAHIKIVNSYVVISCCKGYIEVQLIQVFNDELMMMFFDNTNRLGFNLCQLCYILLCAELKKFVLNCLHALAEPIDVLYIYFLA